MLKRFAPHNVASMGTAVIFALVLTLGLTGCADIFEPKKMFYGVIKNITQWLLYVPNPAKPAEVHELSPNQYFSCELEGSRVYRFEAKLPDGVTYAAFDARINNLSGDAAINGVNVDWAWVIGGPFTACVSPVDGGDLANVEVTIENFRTIDPNLDQPEVVVFRNVAAMSQALKDYERRHPVPSQGKVFPGHEGKANVFRQEVK